ncbi:hypothetical protein [Mesorhizobium sp.]|uniref:antitoxin Xre/MbcA/ParS-like domain-containing protein n=1 Tax=Mesorhizobium sp. TaxID=1871066 RepID=UPI0025D1D25A|nr:hypothetical protein [Mesorhizobium sp.]
MQCYKLIVISNPTAADGDNDNSRLIDEHAHCVLAALGLADARGRRDEQHLVFQPWKCLSVFDCDTVDVRQIIEEVRLRSGADCTIRSQIALAKAEDAARRSELVPGMTMEEGRISMGAGIEEAANAAVSALQDFLRGPEAPSTSTWSELDCQRIDDWAGQVVGPTYLEEHLGIPRSTLHWWQRRNEVVAQRKGSRKHVFPLAQFVDGRPALGIRQVRSLLPNTRLTWRWLIQPSPAWDIWSRLGLAGGGAPYAPAF